MRKATVGPLARYLYQLQLDLTPLPYVLSDNYPDRLTTTILAG